MATELAKAIERFSEVMKQARAREANEDPRSLSLTIGCAGWLLNGMLAESLGGDQ
jgi:hypothetical protein